MNALGKYHHHNVISQTKKGKKSEYHKNLKPKHVNPNYHLPTLTEEKMTATSKAGWFILSASRWIKQLRNQIYFYATLLQSFIWPHTNTHQLLWGTDYSMLDTDQHLDHNTQFNYTVPCRTQSHQPQMYKSHLDFKKDKPMFLIRAN